MPENTRRTAILDKVAATFNQQKRAANEMQLVLEQSGASFDEVAAEFQNTDEILLAVIERTAGRIAQPLGALVTDAEAARRALLEFARQLQAAYEGELVGLHRVVMTEGSRRKELRQRFYDKGPGAIAMALERFFSEAENAGLVEPGDCALAAEQFMGLLREPLYRELALRSGGGEEVGMTPENALALFWSGYGTREAAGEREG